MGEIRIKSGNLFDINGNYSAYVHQGSPTCGVANEQIIVNSIAPWFLTSINFSALIPSGQYIIKCKASANFRAMRLLLTKPFDTGTWNDTYKRYYVDMVKNDNYFTYTFTVDEDFAIGFAISGTTGDTGIVSDIMLNEGSTALPYQPYFLNRPAHKFTNGQWVDIPTHHYTNGRWQGELTSQSPLKFRADGEMLDWRIEGKTNPEPETIVYGIHINPNIQDPSNAVTYLEDAVGMTPASMGGTSFNEGSWGNAFFMPKPCMVRFDGTVDYYLDPADYSKKIDGTASDIADPNYAGNAMMEWGLIWFKFEPGEADGEGYFYVSNKKVDDSFNCWCNYDANNNINPHFYTAIYNGTGTDKLRSISGVQLTPANGSGNTTGQQEITRAMANNTSDSTEWYIDLWADEILTTGLLYLLGKSLNLQATFGRGLDSGGQTAKESYVTGTLNDKGLFWGNTTNGNNAVKVFGMENRWGCCYHRTAGLFGTTAGYAYKLTHGTVDGSTATSFGTNANGYIPISTTKPENGPVSKMSFGKHGMLPSATDGSLTTYYSDYFYKGNGFSLIGGASDSGLYCGFYVSLFGSSSLAYWTGSTSLSLKPRAKIPYNPHNGVGDWDETAQKYKIPVTVEGENLFDGELEQGGVSISGVSVSSAARVRGYANVKPLTAYTITANKAFRLCYGYNYDGLNLERVGLIFDNNSGNNKLSTFTTPEGCNYIRFVLWNGNESNIIPTDIQNLILIEGTYTASTIPLYKTNLFTDHQLMDGDSIDYATTQTAIPIATGNNTLTVDTAVKPKSVFVKFEG